MNNREELIKNYELAGATKEAIQDFKKLSPEAMAVELAEQKEVYDKYILSKEKYLSLSKKEYNRLLKEYDLEDNSDDRKNWHVVLSAVENQKFKDRMSDSVTNYAATDQIEMDVSDARFKLEKLKLSPATKDINDFEHQNLIINLENVIKLAYGIPEQSLVLTDNDLETILVLDSYEMGKSVNAFLESQKPALKNSYKDRMKDILMLRNQTIEAKKRIKEKLKNINQTFDRFKTSPTKIIRRSDGRIEVNKDYVDFCEGIKKFQNELVFLSKSYTGRKVEVPFQDIIDNINAKILQHKL